jgi:hypothetical protein
VGLPFAATRPAARGSARLLAHACCVTPVYARASTFSTLPHPVWLSFSHSPRAQAVIPDIGPLKKLKVVDLRALCGDFNMPSTGTKDQLVQRLDAHRKATQSSVPSRSKVGSASIAERSGAATPESSVKRQRGNARPGNLYGDAPLTDTDKTHPATVQTSSSRSTPTSVAPRSASRASCG